MGSHSLFQGIFPTQELNPGLLCCRQILYIWATREAHHIPQTSTTWLINYSPTLDKKLKQFKIGKEKISRNQSHLCWGVGFSWNMKEDAVQNRVWFFFFPNWSIVALQYCVSCCYRAKRVSYTNTHTPLPWISFPLGHHRTLRGVSLLCWAHAQSFSHIQPCDPMDGRPPGSSIHRISQARILEWAAASFPRGTFPTQGSNLHLLYLLHWQANYFFYHWDAWETRARQ